MLINILILIALIMIVVIWLISRRPSDFNITRSEIIEAPANTIFDAINNLRQWEAWSPWAKLDPKATETFSGPAEGVGAAMAWAGNMKVGVGKMTIIQSRPGEFVGIRLEFEKPMKATNLAEFTLTPTDRGTRISWSMTGKNQFIAKAMGLFMNFDRVVGVQFEQGLASLKNLTEAEPPSHF